MNKTHTANCSNCSAEITTRRPVRPGVRIACSKAECLQAVTVAHNAAVAAFDAERAAQPRKPRVARTSQPLYGDLRWVAAINGLKTDGTGARAS